MHRGEAYSPSTYAAYYPCQLIILNTADLSEEIFCVTILYLIFILELIGESSSITNHICNLT